MLPFKTIVIWAKTSIFIVWQVIKACKTDSEGKVVEGKHHVYRMSASKAEEKDEWIKCIRSVSHHVWVKM